MHPVARERLTGAGLGLGDLAQLPPAFLCGESPSSTATSLRIEGLKNGTKHIVVFLAIDKSGNATGTYFTQPLIPTPATDFWEDLHDSGSDAHGGFCLIADTYGDGGGPGGALTDASGMSSNPVTAKSCPARRPRVARPAIRPSATASL